MYMNVIQLSITCVTELVIELTYTKNSKIIVCIYYCKCCNAGFHASFVPFCKTCNRTKLAILILSYYKFAVIKTSQ